MENKKNTRLPRNFHQTFRPDREHISKLLRFAAAGSQGTIEDISNATGIPTGKFSGKVKPCIDYASAMGLLNKEAKNSVYSFSLTPFGSCVLREDPFLLNPLTQWLAHLQLNHPAKGADLWYQIFVEGADSLGYSFTREELNEHLRVIYGPKARNPKGPALLMYTEEKSFAQAHILEAEKDTIRRNTAPYKQEYLRGYCAWLAQLLRDMFPDQRQISLADLERDTGWQRVTGWQSSDINNVLQGAERLGVLRIDRHMEPWFVELMIDPDTLWPAIYDDMI